MKGREKKTNERRVCFSSLFSCSITYRSNLYFYFEKPLLETGFLMIEDDRSGVVISSQKIPDRCTILDKSVGGSERVLSLLFTWVLVRALTQ